LAILLDRRRIPKDLRQLAGQAERCLNAEDFHPHSADEDLRSLVGSVAPYVDRISSWFETFERAHMEAWAYFCLLKVYNEARHAIDQSEGNLDTFDALSPSGDGIDAALSAMDSAPADVF